MLTKQASPTTVLNAFTVTPARAGVFAVGLALQAAAFAADAPATAPSPAAAASTPAAKWNVNQPPGEKKIANIDVRTGTWMSVDVSPDGQRIVFDLLGDLYVMPVGGGEAKALTHSIAWEMQPRFSPDGKQIAFVSDAGGGDNIWVMNADGTNARAISTEDFRLLNNPVLHPSGKYIAARKHFTGTRSLGSGEIWLYHLDGGKGQQPQREAELAEGPRRARALAGRQVPVLLAGQHAGPPVRIQQEQHRRDLPHLPPGPDRRHQRALRHRPRRRDPPTPSPDGKYLAFIRRPRDAFRAAAPRCSSRT